MEENAGTIIGVNGNMITVRFTGAVAQNGIFNNASQHWNHNLFWEIMGPGEAKKMPGNLEKALTEAFVQTCGGTPQSIHIVIEDIAKENWAIGGGLCSDLYPDPPAEKK